MTNSYKALVRSVLTDGIKQSGRNGLQKVMPFYSFGLDFSCPDAQTHMLKLRRMYYKGVQGEFLTLIDPAPLTNVSQFEVNGCNYWRPWAEADGSINIDYANQMHPQLENLILNIQTDPHSRRHMIDLWVPENVQSKSLSLECCWHNLTFSVIQGVLYMKWTQRSVDVMVGLPSDIYLAYLFMQHIAEHCNLVVGACMFSLSNVHIYEEHIQNAIAILDRTDEDWDVPLYFEVKP